MLMSFVSVAEQEVIVRGHFKEPHLDLTCSKDSNNSYMMTQ